MLKTAEKTFRPLVKNVVDVIFPPRCISCNVLVESQGALCSDCWQHIDFINDPLCHHCGFPFEYNATNQSLCAACVAEPPPYHMARTVMRYDEHSRSLITRFKYADRTHPSKTFAHWMARAGKECLEDAHFLAPVPLHRLKLFTRRYNQSALLAYGIRNIARVPVLPDLLVRRKYTPPQASLSRAQRQENVKHAFALNPRYRSVIADKTVVLVDDVITTGATIEACSRVLLRAGIGQVRVLTLAKTV